jgi:hypothetical protein
VENQRAMFTQEIQAITEEIEKAKKVEAFYREQMIQYNSKQIVMKNREQEYVAFMKHYADKYKIASKSEEDFK